MNLILGKTRRDPPKKGTCGTCQHFHPAVIHTAKGLPLPMWYGRCPHCSVERLETDSCPRWVEKQ